MKYRYEVAGRAYTSERITLSGSHFQNGRAPAQAIVDRYLARELPSVSLVMVLGAGLARP